MNCCQRHAFLFPKNPKRQDTRSDGRWSPGKTMKNSANLATFEHENALPLRFDMSVLVKSRLPFYRCKFDAMLLRFSEQVMYFASFLLR